MLFWLLRAIDGHAKNFSVHLLPGGRFRLAPRYDVLSALPWLGKKPGQLSPHRIEMAMAVGEGRHYACKEIRTRHILETGRRCGLEGGGLPILEDLVARIPGAIAAASEELPPGFPDAIAGPILDGLARAALSTPP